MGENILNDNGHDKKIPIIRNSKQAVSHKQTKNLRTTPQKKLKPGRNTTLKRQ